MNGSKSKIINALSHSNTYISGQALSHLLGISRAGVWKHIKQLREAGYQIDSVQNKGHRLVAFPSEFVAEEVRESLEGVDLFDKVMVYKTIDSTNEEAKRIEKDYKGQTTLLISEEQVAGKGRRGRSWSSQAGQGIYMTLLLHPNIAAYQAPQITLLAGLAVNQGISNMTGLRSGIKWPNDIVINGKKVSGILTEMSTEMNEIQYVILGIGINVNQSEFDECLSGIATSLYLETKVNIDRKALLVEIISQFNCLYGLFQESGNLDFMIDTYNDHCVTVNSEIQIQSRSQTKYGYCNKVLSDGGLEVDINGEKQVVHSGEVSVRGLYGYVDQ